MRHVNVVVALVLMLGSAVLAGEEEGLLEIKTDRVVVFKDGYALVVRTATGEAGENGEVYTEEVPDAAILGSFWAVPAAGELSSMTAGITQTEVTRLETTTCVEILEILTVNKGSACTLELEDGKLLSGVIREVLTLDVPATLQEQTHRGASTPPTTRTTNRAHGTYFVLRSDDRDVLLPVTRVRRIQMADMKVTREREVLEKRSTKRLTFRFKDGPGKKELRIFYFRPGIRWIPTYRVELDPEKMEAEIRLQAEILNEAEDLENVPFDLVVGVPNFRFKDVVSPFVLEAALRDALRQAAPQIMGQYSSNGSNSFANPMSNAAFGARGGEYRDRQAEADPGALDIPEELTAGRSQDLFIYSVPALTLLRGHRAAVPVFTARAPYRDVYTWDFALKRSDVEIVQEKMNSPSPLKLAMNRVWHQIDIENRTSVPWTTGAAMVLQGMQPLAQELLTYTSVGGKVRLPVTVAVDLQSSFSEEETGREMDALTWLRQRYARIDKTGELRVTSFLPHAVDLEITCHLGGFGEEASDEGRITIGQFQQGDWQNYQGHPAVNNHSTVFWRTTLAPGKTFAPTVKYRYFARH